jgi:hypothetical protein
MSAPPLDAFEAAKTSTFLCRASGVPALWNRASIRTHRGLSSQAFILNRVLGIRSAGRPFMSVNTDV